VCSQSYVLWQQDVELVRVADVRVVGDVVSTTGSLIEVCHGRGDDRVSF
jgi:hypothetical protein